jgi:hypothetical protein
MKKVHVIGGGTFSYIAPHLALSAPAFGKVARDIVCRYGWVMREPILHLTKMADHNSKIVTNEDVSKLIDSLIEDSDTKVIFFSAALCDYDGNIQTESGLLPRGKDQQRLKTDDGIQTLVLSPADKIISKIRKNRKDIFLVGFKTTAGATPDEQYLSGLKLLKNASCNLVLANDIHTRLNMIITPEQARYHETLDRNEVIKNLCEMVKLRSSLNFTRSTIIPGESVDWNSEVVPNALRSVVNYCIDKGAYKPFLGSTVGHFAIKIGDDKFLTSKRKTNFNKINEVGLVCVETKNENEVIAHGFRPSVGGQSQRIVFAEHPDVDCIVHFHCPKKILSSVPIRSQREFECGSHECGQNTSSGLKRFELPNEQYLYAVMLDKHGPNIVFNKNVDPQNVINFIEENFDLRGRTDNVDPIYAEKFKTEMALSA